MQSVVSSKKSKLNCREIIASVQAGGDARAAMARVNRVIVAHQGAGEEVPGHLLRLTQALTSEWIAQSQG